jgi:hypothetical protein
LPNLCLAERLYVRHLGAAHKLGQRPEQGSGIPVGPNEDVEIFGGAGLRVPGYERWTRVL